MDGRPDTRTYICPVFIGLLKTDVLIFRWREGLCCKRKMCGTHATLMIVAPTGLHVWCWCSKIGRPRATQMSAKCCVATRSWNAPARKLHHMCPRFAHWWSPFVHVNHNPCVSHPRLHFCVWLLSPVENNLPWCDICSFGRWPTELCNLSSHTAKEFLPVH